MGAHISGQTARCTQDAAFLMKAVEPLAMQVPRRRRTALQISGVTEENLSGCHRTKPAGKHSTIQLRQNATIRNGNHHQTRPAATVSRAKPPMQRESSKRRSGESVSAEPAAKLRFSLSKGVDINHGSTSCQVRSESGAQQQVQDCVQQAKRQKPNAGVTRSRCWSDSAKLACLQRSRSLHETCNGDSHMAVMRLRLLRPAVDPQNWHTLN
jgi:hypothetical protein